MHARDGRARHAGPRLRLCVSNRELAAAAGRSCKRQRGHGIAVGDGGGARTGPRTHTLMRGGVRTGYASPEPVPAASEAIGKGQQGLDTGGAAALFPAITIGRPPGDGAIEILRQVCQQRI